MNVSIIILFLTAVLLEACLGNPLHIYQAHSQYEYSLTYGSYYEIPPPPDYLNPFYKGNLELTETCPDSPPCTSKLNPDKTGPYRCVIDQNCPETYKCCPHSCFNHKICLHSTPRIIPAARMSSKSDSDIATTTDVTDDERVSIGTATSASASASASASTSGSEGSVKEKKLPDYSKKLPAYPGSVAYTRSDGSFSTGSSSGDDISTPPSRRNKGSNQSPTHYDEDVAEDATTINEDVKSSSTPDLLSSESVSLNPDEKKSKGDEPTEVPTDCTDAKNLKETETVPCRRVTIKTGDDEKNGQRNATTDETSETERTVSSVFSFADPTTESITSRASFATSGDDALITDEDFSGSGYGLSNGDDEDY